MCGIIGIASQTDIAPRLVEALKRLEYRGYDSAGIATLEGGKIHKIRAEGKLAQLEAALARTPVHGATGIGHTRWATHGVPSEANAHPHGNGEVVVVHNGIIENFEEIRRELLEKGYCFTSQTDTEVVPLLLTEYLKQGDSCRQAMHRALQRFQGAFGLAVLFAREPGTVYAARRGSPLAIGYGEGEMFVGSDAIALAPFTRKLSYLQDGDWAELRHDRAMIFDASGKEISRPVVLSSLSGAAVGKGNYRHFMQKEIYEQPLVTGECLNAYYNHASGQLQLPPLPIAPKEIERLCLVACGTSHFAAMIARYWLEATLRLPVDLDIASEFRYRQPALQTRCLYVFISQSGETADTLAALRLVTHAGAPTLAVVNAPESTMAQEAGAVLHIFAGPEIGVASTKAFTTQLMTLACLCLFLAQERGSIAAEAQQSMKRALVATPSAISECLSQEDAIAQIAPLFLQARNVLYVGRGTNYPIALEGALKLKELSYIHAEGYAAGELKHGPIALIDEHMPVIVVAPHDRWFEKTLSNLQEARARGAVILLITDEAGAARAQGLAAQTLIMPHTQEFTAPMAYAVPLQLLAYHVAMLKGTDVDQPRNLAKSVTVE